MDFSDLHKEEYSGEAGLPKAISTAIADAARIDDNEVIKATPDTVDKTALSVTGFIIDEIHPSILVNGGPCVYVPLAAKLAYDLKHNPSLINDYSFVCRAIAVANKLQLSKTLSVTKNTTTTWHMKEFFRMLSGKGVIMRSLCMLVYVNSRYDTPDTRDMMPIARLARLRQQNERTPRLQALSTCNIIHKHGIGGLVELIFLVYGMTG
jgi:hypothetical protein